MCLQPEISYNPGQNSFEHLHTNNGNRTNSQDCHRKMSSPLSPLDQCWFEKWNANLTWYKWSSTLIWGRGGGGVWFSIYRRKFDVWIVPVILARIVVQLGEIPSWATVCRVFSNDENGMKISYIIWTWICQANWVKCSFSLFSLEMLLLCKCCLHFYQIWSR